MLAISLFKKINFSKNFIQAYYIKVFVDNNMIVGKKLFFVLLESLIFCLFWGPEEGGVEF
jgi:hypothetical protein